MNIKIKLFSFIFLATCLLLVKPVQGSVTLNIGETYVCNIGYISNFKECVWTTSDYNAVNFVGTVSRYSTSVTVQALSKPSYITPVTIHCQYYYYDLDPTTKRYTYLRSGYKDFQFFIKDNGPTNVSVSPSSLNLDIGQTRTLSVIVSPSSADQTVTWSTSNNSVASVSSYGGVQGKSAGEARITATTKNGKTAYCNVIVNRIQPTEIRITPSSVKLSIGMTRQLSYTLSPNNSSTSVTWKSSNKNIATVSSSGLISAKSEGNTTITATTDNGKTSSSEIIVLPSVSRIKIEDQTIYVGYSFLFIPEIEPQNIETNLTWESSNRNIATIDNNGILKALKSGTTKITVSTDNNVKAEATITIKQPSEYENANTSKYRVDLIKNLINKSLKSK